MLVIIAFTNIDKNKNIYVNTMCECGVIKETALYRVTSGVTKSCGCLHKKTLVIRNTNHGMARYPEYSTWLNMKARCAPNHPNHEHYYDRGINVCDEWLSNFPAFYKHIGPKPTPKHSLDRINNDKGYEIGNIRWATQYQQVHNRRNSKVKVN